MRWTPQCMKTTAVNNQHSPDTNYKHILGVEGWKMGAKEDVEKVDKNDGAFLGKYLLFREKSLS